MCQSVTAAGESAPYSQRISKAEFDRQVQYCRGLLCIALAFVYIYKQEIDLWIADVYTNQILTSWVFRHDSFEPSLSSFCFFLYLMYWVAVDYYVPAAWKFRIQNSDDNKTWKDRHLTWIQESAYYLLPWLLVIDPVFPRRDNWLKSPKALEPPTLDRIVYDVFMGLFYYDMFFFLGHFMLHKVKVLYEYVHSRHHMFATVRAGDAIRHTFLDGTMDVFYSVMALKVTGAHFLSRAIYDMVAIWLLSEAHSGMDFPWMLHNLIPFRLMGGSVVHDLHHRSGNKNFSKYFTHFDWIFGSLKWEDPRESREACTAKKIS